MKEVPQTLLILSKNELPFVKSKVHLLKSREKKDATRKLCKRIQIVRLG